MIRLIVQERHMCPDGSVVETSHRTIDIEHAALEAILTAKRDYYGVCVIGAEVVPPST